jgi:hypothetical protein
LSWVKFIAGHEGIYAVTRCGKVVSYKGRKPRWLRPGPNGHGYHQVNLYRDGTPQAHRVHRLVAEAFIGPRPEGLYTCHNDGNSKNNHADNLRYDTPSSNQTDRVAHGTSNRGTRNRQAKLNAGSVREMRRLYAAGGVTLAQLSERFGVSMATVSLVVNRKRWAHIDEEEAS